MGFKRIDTTSNRLKIAMKNSNKKQIDLVRETGIDKGSMSHYVNGKYEPKQDVIFELAKALNVSEMWLWGYDCDMHRPIEEKTNHFIESVVDRMESDTLFFETIKIIFNLDDEKFRSLSNTIMLIK